MKTWHVIALIGGGLVVLSALSSMLPDAPETPVSTSAAATPATPSVTPPAPTTRPAPRGPAPLVIEGYSELGVYQAGKEALRRLRKDDMTGRLTVTVRTTDSYGNTTEVPGFTLLWAQEDLERMNLSGMDEYRLINLAKLPNDSVDGIDGAAALNKWCGKPDNRSLTPGFCGRWAVALSGE